MEDKRTVPVISEDAYGDADYTHRSATPPARVTAYALEHSPGGPVLVSLWVDRPGQSSPSCVVLSLPAAHQIGKALRQAVKDCLNGEATEELP